MVWPANRNLGISRSVCCARDRVHIEIHNVSASGLHHLGGWTPCVLRFEICGSRQQLPCWPWRYRAPRAWQRSRPRTQRPAPGIASIQPANGAVVGVAHPVIVTFTGPVRDRAAAERSIKITDAQPHQRAVPVGRQQRRAMDPGRVLACPQPRRRCGARLVNRLRHRRPGGRHCEYLPAHFHRQRQRRSAAHDAGVDGQTQPADADGQLTPRCPRSALSSWTREPSASR